MHKLMELVLKKVHLVLFPSYVDHSVNENLSNEERIVISFNITIQIKTNKKFFKVFFEIFSQASPVSISLSVH